ncbi:MAG: copper-translocating P-type ATPase [gamma proteobacterium symbiont of Ctena orbiculata]|nr:MAG: copper-translocating P-type ATPase [gamma proteobacterium symbiont of Ctena orbiculata]
MHSQQQADRETTSPAAAYQLSITGMTCQHCVAAVEKAVAGVPDVAQVEVSLTSNTARIIGGSPQLAIAAIREAGYEAQSLSETPSHCPLPATDVQQDTDTAALTLTDGYTLTIDDMTCASCVAAVERAIRSVDGVSEAVVNLVEKRAQVIGGDPDKVVDRVVDQGYGAHLDSTHRAPDELLLEITGLAQDAQRRQLSRLLQTLDPEAGLDQEKGAWRIHTRLHPAQLLIELEHAGISARLVEPFTDPYAEEAAAAAAEVRRSWQRALLAGVVGITLMIAEMSGNTPLVSESGGESFWLGIAILCLFVMRFSGGHYYLGAWKQAKHLSANMDTLVALGTGTAWLASLLIVVQPQGLLLQTEKLYFDASVLILAFLQFGHVLETRAKRTTSEAVGALVGLAPKIAQVIHGGEEVSVPVSLLRLGDRIQVRPGERIPIDGEVVEGESTVDESMLTGESLPVCKQPGALVTGGTMNRNGTLRFQVTRLGEETTLAHIIAMVRKAQMSKPPIARLVDRVSAIFVPVVVVIAVITFIVWQIVAPQPSLPYALTASIAVLVIACPCALGLATPIAIMVGTSRAAQLNVLIRNSEGLQRASGLTHLVVDKTGTLTRGSPTVTSLYPVAGVERRELIALAASVESQASHPLAEAIVDYAGQLGIDLLPVAAFNSHPGRSVEGSVSGMSVELGGNQLLTSNRLTPPAELLAHAEREAAQAGTPVWVMGEGRFLGLLILKDPLRHDSQTAVESLREHGVELVICSGDNRATVEAVARALGVGAVHSELLPAQKLEIVKGLQQQGHRVGMVGDGVNDAPALAQADTGFAIGSGTDVAIENADITLVGDSLLNVSTAIALSRATLRNIKQNLFGAFIYNVIGIPMAAGVLYPLTGWLLPPMFASAAMALSSVTVVTNANRLRFFQASKEAPLSITLKVSGMTCPHCVMNVSKALQAQPGVVNAEVSLEEAQAVVTGSADQEALVNAVVEAGYSVESVSS